MYIAHVSQIVFLKRYQLNFLIHCGEANLLHVKSNIFSHHIIINFIRSTSLIQYRLKIQVCRSNVNGILNANYLRNSRYVASHQKQRIFLNIIEILIRRFSIHPAYYVLLPSRHPTRRFVPLRCFSKMFFTNDLHAMHTDTTSN